MGIKKLEACKSPLVYVTIFCCVPHGYYLSYILGVYYLLQLNFTAYKLVNILNQEVTIDGKRNYVVNAIKIYCKSVFDAINDNDVSLIRFYSNEL